MFIALEKFQHVDIEFPIAISPQKTVDACLWIIRKSSSYGFSESKEPKSSIQLPASKTDLENNTDSTLSTQINYGPKYEYILKEGDYRGKPKNASRFYENIVPEPEKQLKVAISESCNPSVMLSFCSENLCNVLAIKEILEHSGIIVNMEKEESLPGSIPFRSIIQAIDNSQIVILCISP